MIELRKETKWSPGYLTIHLPARIPNNKYYSRRKSVAMMIVVEEEICRIIDVINMEHKRE